MAGPRPIISPCGMDRARKRKEQRNKINCQQHDVPFTEMRFHDADPASFTNSVPCSQAIQILVIVELGRAREKVSEKAWERSGPDKSM